MTAPVFMGGEDIDFVGTVQISTDASRYNSSYSRCAIAAKNTSTAYMYTNSRAFSEITSGWFRCVLYPSGDALNADYLWVGLVVNDSNYGLWLGARSSDRSAAALYLYTSGGITAIAYGDANSLALNTKHTVDIEISNYGASATVNVYLNSTLAISYSGDITISGKTGYTRIGIGGRAHTARSWFGWVSECLIRAEPTLAIYGVQTSVPTGAGDINEMTGAYTDINEVTNSDATTLYSDTPDDLASFAKTAMPAGDYRVTARGISARVYRSPDAAVTQIKLGEKTTGGAYNLGDAISADLGVFKTYSRIIDSEQTKTQADNTQIALQVIA